MHKISNDFQSTDTTHLKKGMKVAHPKFGIGTVTKLDTLETEKKAKVDFINFGEKTLLLNFVKLKVLDNLREE